MKDATICNCTAGSSFKFAATFIGLMLGGVLLIPSGAAAQTCMQDNAGFDLNCNAKEVFINRDVLDEPLITATVVDGDDCDFVGDTATVDISANIHFNADRFDVGVYSALDGGDAVTGACAVDIAPFSPNPFLDADGTPDTCGDVDCPGGGCDTSDPFTFQELTLTCVDNDGDGKLDWTTCFSWRTSGNNELCTGPTNIFPGTPSKCFCETINLNDIPVPKTIEVKKVTVADTSGGTFDLQIDDVTDPDANDIGNGGSTGKEEVTVGDHTVGEVAGSGNNLAFYQTNIACVDEANGNTQVASCMNCTSLSVTVPNTQTDIVCTITNTLVDLCAGVDCSDLDDSCNVGVCNPSTGVCEAVPLPDGDLVPCDDGDACTADEGVEGSSDLCVGGVCTGQPVDCSALDDSCNDGACNDTTGVCEAAPKPLSTECEDGDFCTSETGVAGTSDHCDGAGTCVGVPVDCSALDDSCNDGACNDTTGVCEAAPKPLSTECEDGDFCTSETGVAGTSDHCDGAGTCVGVPVDCSALDDSCNDGACNDTTGVCEAAPKPLSTECEDGDFCTSETGVAGTSDHCDGAGTCVGVPVDCSALDDSCNDGACNDTTGVCEAAPKPLSTECEDGDFCTSETGVAGTSDHCDGAGTCVGVPVDCSALDDSCNDGACNDTTGVCEAAPKPLSTECEDGDFCTSETGVAGTSDHCDGAGTCVGVPVDCSALDDSCNDGACNDTTGVCEAAPKPLSTECEDGDFCTSETGVAGTSDHCDGAGTCVGVPVDCSALDDSCNDGACNDTTGVCEAAPKPLSTECEDGDFCTSETGVAGTSDHCDGAGTCVGVPVDCSALDDSCNDGACNDTTGVCEAAPKPLSTECEDGDFCTSETGVAGTSDHCDGAGTCVGVPVDCSALDDSCNDGACNDTTGVCEAAPKPLSTECEDGDFCTSETGVAGTSDHCDGAGTCVGVPVDCSALDDSCNDGACNDTTGVCEAAPKPLSTECEDGDFCTSETGVAGTSDHCDGAGTCVGVPVDCSALDDSCNDGACNDTTGVCEAAPKPLSTECEDGDFCTSETGVAGTSDHCDGAGTCVGVPVDCSALDDSCNDGACNDTTGVCEAAPKPLSTECEDGDFCTSETGVAGTSDHCDGAGTCVGVPVDCSALDDSCNDGVCNAGTGGCEAAPKPLSTECEDGDFCTSETGVAGTPDHCDGAGTCVGVAVDCSALDDSCNDGVCNAGTGVCFADPKADSTPCEDGDFCTSETGVAQTPDHCSSGVCTGIPVDCSADDDQCNVGTCDTTDGACFADPKADSTPCEDGDACTSETGAEGTPDHCSSGVCTGIPVDCSDGVFCTDDSCNDTDGTCINEPIDANCDQTANDCTAPDTCDPVDDCQPNNLDCASVTDSSLCEFDYEVKDGRQFRLLYTPDVKSYPGFKLTASNSGQFYYNLFYAGDPGATTVTIEVPYPFVTVGATPVHVYDGDEVFKDIQGGNDCFLPPDDALTPQHTRIFLEDWIAGTIDNNRDMLNCDQWCGPDDPDQELEQKTCTFDVDFVMPDSGIAYVNVHLDYGLKGPMVDANPCDDGAVDRYDRGTTPSAWNSYDALEQTEDTPNDGPVAIADCQDYTFSHGGFSDTVQNLNIFKEIAGAFGQCQNPNNGVPCSENLTLELVRNDTLEVVQTGQTDEDGFYALPYRHRGRPSLYTVLLYEPNCTVIGQEIELQGNGWSNVNLYIDETADPIICTSTAEYGKGRNKNKR